MDSAFNQPTSTTPERNWQRDQCSREGSKLERELAAVTEQRDRLAEAMRAMWPFIEEDPPCGGKSEIQQYLQALAAVEGGSDE
jgi:hypothetical protein